MLITKKSQYALRAVLGIAKKSGTDVLTIDAIAEAQNIPRRFLGGILTQLTQGGVLMSRRGKTGGYALARPAQYISVGDVVRIIEGPLDQVCCQKIEDRGDCIVAGGCAFIPMWKEAFDALNKVFDKTTVNDLVEREKSLASASSVSYSI